MDSNALPQERSSEYQPVSRRTARISELETGKREWIAGRILCSRPQPYLIDESGWIPLVRERTGTSVRIGAPDPFELLSSHTQGTILEVCGTKEIDGFCVGEFRCLTPARKPWPDRPVHAWQRWSMDPHFRERIRSRNQILRAIREFFCQRGFVEAQTPIIVDVPGTEPHLDVFETALRSPAGTSRRSFLHTSPEFAMKRLLCGGLERMFQICSVFRNGELSRTHQPEFTMLEWYRAYSTYEALQVDCEELLREAVRAIGATRLLRAGSEIDVDGSFERLTVAEAMERYVIVPYGLGKACPERGSKLFDPDVLRKLAQLRGFVSQNDSDGPDHETLFFQILLTDIEPNLGMKRPTFLLDYPRWQAALARTRGDVAERVELYVGGIELANGFTELNDPVEQCRRFRAELDRRTELGQVEYGIDEGLLEALEFGMPPAAGMALGIDRLIALLLDVDDLAEITLLPYQERFPENR